MKRSEILDLPQISVVSASAGSGKTYILAKKYIKLLISSTSKSDDVFALQNILAITFTNKAAIEMKNRILDLLKKIALDKFANPEEKADILFYLSVDEQFARVKAQNIINYIVRKYNFFQVQTIDSFVNSVLSSSAFKLSLSANFKIEDNYQDYFVYSLDKQIDKAGMDKKVLNIFHSFIMQYLQIENKKGWSPKNDILSIINTLFKSTNTYGKEFKKNKSNNIDLGYKKENVVKLIRKLNDNLPEGIHKTFEKSLNKYIENNYNNFSIDEMPDFTKDKIPVSIKTIVPDNIEKLWQDIRIGIDEICTMEAGNIFDCYIDIFDMVAEDFNYLSKKDNVLFLEELNKKAKVIFGDKLTSVSELYLRLATRFNHFLIDEFQDTSKLQWQNLFLMIEEALSTGGTLFYVGDKKQAIYRFRGGEIYLFDEAKKQFNVKSQTEFLSKNFRSQKEIVEFNNWIFSKKNLEKFILDYNTHKKNILDNSDINNIISIFEDSQQTFKKENICGYVRMESIDAKNIEKRNEITKDKILYCLSDLKNRFQYKDIAILLRENSDVDTLTRWLLEKNIPVESDKTLNIRENPLIKELISFMKFLNSPIDNLSFASFILGNIFTAVSGLKKEDIQGFILKFRKKDIYLYKEFQAKLPEVWDKFIDEFFKNVGFIPLYEFTVNIISKFEIPKNFPKYHGFFMKLLDLIKSQEEENTGISSFLEYFDNVKETDLYVNVTDANSVKISTIHKSKGLEFLVVILPFLEMDIKAGTNSFIVSSETEQLVLFSNKKSYRDFSISLNEKYKEEYKRSFIDELNSVYVAFTRAKYELHIFIPAKCGNSDNPAKFLIPDTNLERGAKKCYETNDFIKKSELINLHSLKHKNWMHLLKNEFIYRGNKENLLKGDILHFILSSIGNLHNEDKVLIIEEAIKKAKIKFPYANNFEEFEEVIRKLIEKESFKKFFFVEDGYVFQEKEIVSSTGDTKRIDRIIIKQNEIWIIEYKSSEKELHKKQVMEYIDLLKNIDISKKIQAFLVYLDTLSMEEVNG
ncbi:MAG: UvrD-helicase domain-containing protein [Candidatus Firestonebacteria bacterium]